MLRKRAKQFLERVPRPFDDLYINEILSFQLCDANIIVKMKIVHFFFAKG